MLNSCNQSTPTQSQEGFSVTAELLTIAQENPLTQTAVGLLKASGAQPLWEEATLQQDNASKALAVPLIGRSGLLTIILNKDNSVFDVTLTLTNENGVVTFIDLGNRYGLQVDSYTEKVIAFGQLPEVALQSLTPVDEITFLPEDELSTLGYYDKSECVPDALYERLISAQELYENARDAFLLAAAAAAYKAFQAARICATAETGITIPACLKASKEAAAAAISAAYLGYRMRQAASKVRQIRRLINERLKQCKKSN